MTFVLGVSFWKTDFWLGTGGGGGGGEKGFLVRYDAVGAWLAAGDRFGDITISCNIINGG